MSRIFSYADTTKGILNAVGGMNSSGDTNNVTMNISLPSVKNYEDFMNQMTSDKRFSGYIQAITTDQLNGKSAIRKNRYSWGA